MQREEHRNTHHAPASTSTPRIRRAHWALLPCLILLLPACNNKMRIPKNDFIDILGEIHTAQAYFAAEAITNPRWMDTIPYNHHIVEQHGYQWAQFDSTISWYTTRPAEYMEVYEAVMTRLSEQEKAVLEELDPPSELWNTKNAYQLPADGGRDTIPASVLLKGVGAYTISARIRIYPQDAALDPRIALYLWRSDTTELGVRDTIWTAPLHKNGLMYQYRTQKTLHPGNEFTHLRGNWMQHSTNNLDTAWAKRAEIIDISVYHTPMKF